MNDDPWLATSPRERIPLEDRLELRRWSPEHADVLGATVASSVDHLRPWMPWATDGYGRDEAEQFLHHARRAWDQREEFTYGVWDGEELIGSVGLHARIGAGRLEIGYWVRVERAGRGLARRAAAALVVTAFELPDVEAVQIRHHPDNVASGRIPEVLGFEHLGVLAIGSTDPDDDRELTSVWELTRAAFHAGRGRLPDAGREDGP